MKLTELLFFATTVVPLLPGCASSRFPGDDDPLGGALSVQGQVVDFASGQAVAGAATISASGLVPAPTVTVQGVDFTLSNVPAHSIFNLMAAVPPTHHATISQAISVETSDLDEVSVPAISESYLSTLTAAFGVTPAASKGLLLARMVDAAGAPLAGVSATAIALDAGADVAGPYFLDENLQPAPQRTSTSASGWVLFVQLAPGVAALKAAAQQPLVVDMPMSPVNAGAVTLATAKVRYDVAAPPQNVSFSRQIVPIFSRRGCDGCHSGNGIGRDLGNLTLDGSDNLIYKELTSERVGRVVVAAPDNSLLLTMPTLEAPSDGHPNVTFQNRYDVDFVLLHTWIKEGARQN